ncbi:MAG: hypothetical protein OXD30_04965 [Bryobacterales bacterium]|nr:hypothetical protein [Bryobacterales bacterium]
MTDVGEGVNTYLLVPFKALVQWDRKNKRVRCSQVPEELRKYLTGANVTFPPEQIDAPPNGRATQLRPDSPITSDADLFNASLEQRAGNFSAYAP